MVLCNIIYEKIGNFLPIRDFMTFCSSSRIIYESTSVVDCLLSQGRITTLIKHQPQSSRLQSYLENLVRITPNHRNDDCGNIWSYLWLALQCHHFSIVNILLKHAMLENSLQEIFIRSIFSNNTAGTAFLLKDPRIDPSLHDMALRVAIDNADKKMGYGFSLKSSEYDYRYAAHTVSLEIIEMLLRDPRVDPSAGGNAAIQFASKYGYVKLVEQLLQDARVNPADKENLALCFACEFGYVDIIERLIKHPSVPRAERFDFAMGVARKKGIWVNETQKIHK